MWIKFNIFFHKSILICKNLKEEDYETFKIVTEPSRMFSTENKKGHNFEKELGVYYFNRSANNSYREIVKILNICNIPLKECLLRYEKRIEFSYTKTNL